MINLKLLNKIIGIIVYIKEIKKVFENCEKNEYYKKDNVVHKYINNSDTSTYGINKKKGQKSTWFSKWCKICKSNTHDTKICY